MQITVEATSNLGRKMTVEVPAERIDAEVKKRLKNMTQTVKIHGFRPGKVPLRIVKQRFGSQVYQEVANEMLASSYQDAVIQEKLRPAGGPHIEPTDQGQGEGLKYIATFEVYPDIELESVEELEIKKPIVEITEADVDNMLQKLREQRKTWQEVARDAALDDRVVIDFEGKVDGEPFEGGSATDVSVDLGSGRMLKSFEDQLIGVTAGDERNIEVAYPDDYHKESLA